MPLADWSEGAQWKSSAEELGNLYGMSRYF